MKNDDVVSVVDRMMRDIAWLDKNRKSSNVLAISRVVDSLTISAVNLGEYVSEAYAMMNELEDDYKIAVAEFIKNYNGSNAAAEREADAVPELNTKRKAFTTAKNGYKKLNTFLDRVDKLTDSHKQKISVIKQTEMKHL